MVPLHRAFQKVFLENIVVSVSVPSNCIYVKN